MIQALLASILFLPIIACVLLVSITLYQERHRRAVEHELILDAIEERQRLPEIPIVERSESVIGEYLGLHIHEWVRLLDGRTFVFESIAVEQLPGSRVYYSDDQHASYVVIDRCLLYREAKCLDK